MYEQKQAEAAEQAQRKAAIVAEQEQRRLRLERQERINREVRERELRDMHFQVAQQKAWQRNVDLAARNAIAQQHRQALIAELDAYFNPPPPPPEPEVIYIEQSDGSPHFGPDYNPKLAGQAVLRWW